MILLKRYMKNLNKSIFVFLFFILMGIGFCSAFAEEGSILESKNVILIGWDGCDRAHLKKILSDGQLPNLEQLIDGGSLVFTEVTTGRTSTKPGWAEILTGYSAIRLEIPNNRHYKPTPKGYTIFERLEKHFGADNIVTIFIGGKINNIGSRGPHEICINCISRDPVTHRKLFYWDKQRCIAPTRNGKPRRWVPREGEPYFNSKKATDFHLTALGSARNVAKEALAALDRYHHKSFFAFFHFEEPDEQGHLYGENSFEYSEGLKTADYWLGIIVEKLKSLGIYDKTTIFVTSDHGMDEGGFEHHDAPYIFFATNSKKKIRDGDRKDITPTILEEYEIDLRSIKPSLDGRSLFIDSTNKLQER